MIPSGAALTRTLPLFTLYCNYLVICAFENQSLIETNEKLTFVALLNPDFKLRQSLSLAIKQNLVHISYRTSFQKKIQANR